MADADSFSTSSPLRQSPIVDRAASGDDRVVTHEWTEFTDGVADFIRGALPLLPVDSYYGNKLRGGMGTSAAATLSAEEVVPLVRQWVEYTAPGFARLVEGPISDEDAEYVRYSYYLSADEGGLWLMMTLISRLDLPEPSRDPGDEGIGDEEAITLPGMTIFRLKHERYKCIYWSEQEWDEFVRGMETGDVWEPL
jgi:hypothetical protein